MYKYLSISIILIAIVSSYIEVNNNFYSITENNQQCFPNNDISENNNLLLQRYKILEFCNLSQQQFENEISTILANTGPSKKRKIRFPVDCSSSIISVPVISDGIRSGVNWIRLNLSSSASDNVFIKSVLASPGTPSKRTCPRHKSDIKR